MRTRRFRSVTLPTFALWACCIAALSACGPGAEPPSPTPAPLPGAIELAAIGDSITEADSPNFASGELGDESWVTHAVTEHLSFVGGWARWGATTDMMADEVEPIEADVLVILAGTNDGGLDSSNTATNVREIVDTAGVGRVIISAIPPLDWSPSTATSTNRNLRALADREGWEWVDAPAGLREGGSFKPGMASDGVHPTAEGAAVIGHAVREAVLEPCASGPNECR